MWGKIENWGPHWQRLVNQYKAINTVAKTKQQKQMYNRFKALQVTITSYSLNSKRSKGQPSSGEGAPHTFQGLSALGGSSTSPSTSPTATQVS